MRQDRRLNGWVLIASIVELIAGIIVLLLGAGLSAGGYFYMDIVQEIEEVNFIMGQNIFTQFGLVKEMLYLYVGIGLGVIGLILIVLALTCMTYVKKRKVVRRRLALFIFTLIPLGISGGLGWYLFNNYKWLDGVIKSGEVGELIKYLAFGIIGVFGVVALFNLLGLLFGRSEKFMSNDNNKYAFNDNLVKSERAKINNRPEEPKQVKKEGYELSEDVQDSQINAEENQEEVLSEEQSTESALRFCKMCSKLLRPDEKICTVCGYKDGE